MEITKDIRYVGVDDHDIDLFEGQYDVSENGMAYNSYVILGEKIAVIWVLPWASATTTLRRRRGTSQ